jgi:Na+-transporting NADH:ubiquinone oxidoreductase subunit C
LAVKGNLYTLGYAAFLAIVCATALTAMDRFTADRKLANEQAEETRTMLGVLDVPFDESAPAEELLSIFEENVRTESRGGLEYYVYDHPKAGTLWAVRFAGQGLWAPVEGLLCLRSDLRTIYRISFYKQEETPGLGGDISTDWFQDQFRGKLIATDTVTGIRVVRTEAEGPSEVDAISGATMTCDKVEAMLDNVIQQIVAEDSDVE